MFSPLLRTVKLKYILIINRCKPRWQEIDKEIEAQKERDRKKKDRL